MEYVTAGVIAARQGYRVLFDTAAGWVQKLTQAHDQGELLKLLAKLGRYDLLIVDEVGYIPIEAEAANLFFYRWYQPGMRKRR